jgi:hypothetical protein
MVPLPSFVNYSSNQSVAYDWKEPVRIYGYLGENKVNYLFSLRSSLHLTVFFHGKYFLGVVGEVSANVEKIGKRKGG